jgi:tetratricopeptide (TPR) repeat protein
MPMPPPSPCSIPRRRGRLGPAGVGLLAALVAAPVVAAPCEAIDPTTAEVNAREGVRLAKNKQFTEAVPLFRIAVRLDACSPEYPLLLARGLARTEQPDEARSNYKLVLDTFPNTPEANAAQKELAELEVALLTPKKPEKNPEGTAPVDTGFPFRWVGLGTMGAGALSLVMGAVFALDAQEADDALQTASRQPNRARYDELVDQRSGSSTLAWTFYGLGTALVAGGAVMAFVLHEAPTTEAKAGLALLPGGLGVSWSAEF